jgi:hypothetical protein
MPLRRAGAESAGGEKSVVPLPSETLIDLVARNPGRTVRELLRILAREGGPTLTKRQLNLALYRSPSLHWKPGAGEKRLWYVSDMGHTPAPSRGRSCGPSRPVEKPIAVSLAAGGTRVVG